MNDKSHDERRRSPRIDAAAGVRAYVMPEGLGGMAFEADLVNYSSEGAQFSVPSPMDHSLHVGATLNIRPLTPNPAFSEDRHAEVIWVFTQDNGLTRFGVEYVAQRDFPG